MSKTSSTPSAESGETPRRPLEDLPDFDAVSYDAWRQRVDEQLAGRSFDGSLTHPVGDGWSLEPLYSRDHRGPDLPEASTVPGVSPYLSGERPRGALSTPWRIAQEYDDPRRHRAAEALLQDRQQGLQLAWLRFDRQVRSSFTRGGAGGDGLRITKPRHLDELLGTHGETDLDVVLDAGAAAPIVFSLWLESARRRGVAWSDLSGCAGMDPLGALARDGRLAMPLEEAWRQLADLAHGCAEHAPGVRAALVSTVVHHEAGASAVDEVALALAIGAAYLKRLEASGMSLDAAAGQLLFSFAVGDDLFVEMAKLRAARMLWARLLTALGVPPEARAMRQHARTSERSASRRDPWINLLRGAGQSFAAAVAGVWSLTLRPFDAALGQSDRRGRRLAINAHHLLAEESHLGRVADPAAGSWALESMTDSLARAAWQRFRELEEAGGVEMALLSGRLAGRMKRFADVLRQEVAQGRRPLIGISTFPQLDDEMLQRPQPEASPVEIDESSFPPGMTAARLEELAVASEATSQADGRLLAAAVAAVADGATATDVAQLMVGEGPVSCQALEAVRLASPFEDLRAASDEWKEQHGRRPRVLLVHLGPLAEHGPRASFLRNLFATGGVETVASEPCLDVDGAAAEYSKQIASGGEVDGAVLCGTDGRYEELMPHLAPALKAAGAKWLFMGGRPRDQESTWTQAGVDIFLFQGCDVLTHMETFLGDLGVIV